MDWSTPGLPVHHQLPESTETCPLSRLCYPTISSSVISFSSHYCGQESLRRNGVAVTVNKRVQNAVLGCNLKRDRMISIRFQGKPFNITVIQVYAQTSNAEEAWSWMVLWRSARPSRTNTKKRHAFHYKGLECKNLGSILIFTILILQIHEHGIFLHLFVSSLISFINVL